MANGVDMRGSQIIFVDNRNFPGGPAAYTSTTYSEPINLMCTAACVIGGWLQDALLVWLFCSLFLQCTLALLSTHFRSILLRTDIPFPRDCISSVVDHCRSYRHFCCFRRCVLCRSCCDYLLIHVHSYVVPACGSTCASGECRMGTHGHKY